jgi:alpha-mannosidase
MRQDHTATTRDKTIMMRTTRRGFLRMGILGGLGAAAWPLLSRPGMGAGAADHFCIAICCHWSYTGIGFNLGIESDVLSVTDAMEFFNRPPHMKTCLEMDARCYEKIAEIFPEVAARLRGYLAAGQIELIGGTYGQPMGTTISGESNIRQIVMGREAIRKVLGCELATFLEEEEFTHPQVPQIVAGAGYRYASLANQNTWGRTGVPRLEYNVIDWKGVDGTTLRSTPLNSLFLPGGADSRKLPGSPAFKELQARGRPLFIAWQEYGWEDPEHPAYLPGSDYVIAGDITNFKALASQYPVEFVTLTEYLDKYGAKPEKMICLTMHDFNKWLTWGVGGDQVRIMDRKVEGVLLAAELFDAAAAALGARSQAALLDRAWKDLLASQSHDVGLCEYSRWQGGLMAPLDRLEDKHNFYWGALGYNLLDSAQEQGQAVLDTTLKTLAAGIRSRRNQQGPLVATVFNPLGQERTDLVLTGRVHSLPEKTEGIVVKDRAGYVVPSQIVKTDQDQQGNFTVAELAFMASKVPSAGYDTYYLEPAIGPKPASKTSLVIDQSKFRLENEFLRVELNPNTGAIASLIHKSSGREMLDGKRGAFPRFTGKPNPDLSLRPGAPASFDSASSQGRLDWVAHGPLFATVRARHHFAESMSFETRVTLCASRPYVEVVSRLLAWWPPLMPGIGPVEMSSGGYWLSFTPAFEVSQVVRDYPLAVEPTVKSTFHALTFADVLGKEGGLLLLHPGTQWFARDDKGAVGNLIMREWASFFDREYGWPAYSEYRHALWPHGLEEMSNAARLRAAAAFTRPLLCHVDTPRDGRRPPVGSFIRLKPDTLLLSSFRKTEQGLELRVLENEGQPAEATVQVDLPVKKAVETDLLGRPTGEVTHHKGQLSFRIAPWKFRTFELT